MMNHSRSSGLCSTCWQAAFWDFCIQCWHQKENAADTFPFGEWIDEATACATDYIARVQANQGLPVKLNPDEESDPTELPV